MSDVVQGWTDNRFAGVREAFAANFAKNGEVGASFSAYHRGRKVVDLWGGVADPATGRKWEEDAIVLVFSTTKGVTAMCANKLAQEGVIDVDAPVAKYWPEFAAAGKADIPVSYLLSHQAGLAWFDGEMSLDDALAWGPVIERLAEQPPVWEPGASHGYHATTYGWLVGEVIRRATGRTIGTYLREEIATPLGVDFWIGLPASEESRVAPLQPFLSKAMLANEDVRNAVMSFLGPQTELGRSLSPGGVWSIEDEETFNSARLRAAEVPAANGVGEARGLARLYSSCINEVDGIRLLTPEQLKAATTQQTTGPNRVLLNLDVQFGLGFMVHSTIIPLGSVHSFGHYGLGGSVGWADPDAELAVGYTMNKLDVGLTGDVRSVSLVKACYDSL